MFKGHCRIPLAEPDELKVGDSAPLGASRLLARTAEPSVRSFKNRVLKNTVLGFSQKRLFLGEQSYVFRPTFFVAYGFEKILRRNSDGLALRMSNY